MKLYFALCPSEQLIKPLTVANVKLCLASYYYFSKGKGYEIGSKLGLLNKFTFWDSGAFSAFNSGKPINLKLYCKFIKDKELSIYASLDDIGSPEQSLNNYKYMISEGLKPIPCFHIGEPLEFLDHIISEPYIALGGMVMSANIEKWLDGVFSYIHTKRDDLKIHGFGLTDPNLILKYPWYSVDSSSWLGCVRFGRFSKWNERSNNFYSISIREKLETMGIFYIPGLKLIGEERSQLILEQIKEFQKMEEYLIHKKDNRNYSYLTDQQKLF